jgi:hypothetical protein
VTDLAIPDQARDRAPAVQAEQPMDRATALVEWANAARQAADIAVNLANTSFVPASLRGKPADITAAILAGQELGLQPMATLRSMDVIQGTPALRAHAMRGLVQSRGHDIELIESTPEKCVMRGRRAGTDTWQSVTWTIQRASQLGLLSKDQWKKQPQTMLIARATGELCRLIASDVLYAMPYAAEELHSAPAGDADVVVQAPRVTLEEITGPRMQVRSVTATAADPWAAVEYPDPVDAESLPETYETAAWPTAAQPGGAE